MPDPGEPRSAELIQLGSDGYELNVRVTGRYGPGVPGPHDDLNAEFRLTAGPFEFRVADVVSRSELHDWSRCLDDLARGEEATWRDSGRTVTLTVTPLDSGARVKILDEPESGAELLVPLRLPGDWVDHQRELLRRLTVAFPAETVETSPGVWTWARRTHTE